MYDSSEEYIPKNKQMTKKTNTQIRIQYYIASHGLFRTLDLLQNL